MFQKTLMAMALATSVFVVGCGGSSSGSSGGSGGGGGGTATDERTEVTGPLDAVQEPVSSQVVSQLATAAAGTPLEGVVQCVDELVVGDTIDVLDVIALGLEEGATTMDVQAALTGTAADVQAQLGDVVTNLQGLLAALAGTGGCDGLGTGFSADVLDGTPLAPLGDALAPVLAQIEAATGSGTAPNLGTLAGLYGLLAQALNSGLTSLPQEAQDAPVLGPALSLVATAVEDVGLTLAAATSGDAADTQTAVATTLGHILDGLLLGVVPITTLETEAGQAGVLSGPISDAIDQLVAAIAGGSSDLGEAGLPAEIEAVLTLLTDPGTGTDPTGLLTGLLDELQAALAGGSTGGTLPDIGSAELNEAIAQITTLLATAGDTGTPLDLLVGSVVDILGDLLGGLGLGL